LSTNKQHTLSLQTHCHTCFCVLVKAAVDVHLGRGRFLYWWLRREFRRIGCGFLIELLAHRSWYVVRYRRSFGDFARGVWLLLRQSSACRCACRWPCVWHGILGPVKRPVCVRFLCRCSAPRICRCWSRCRPVSRHRCRNPLCHAQRAPALLVNRHARVRVPCIFFSLLRGSVSFRSVGVRSACPSVYDALLRQVQGLSRVCLFVVFGDHALALKLSFLNFRPCICRSPVLHVVSQPVEDR